VAPDVLFLSETKHDSKWMEWLRWKLGMTNLVVKDSVGASGGLAIFWRKEVNLCVKSFLKYHIDTVIKEDNGVLWQFTGIYGESKSEEKDNTWELLRLLKTKFDLPFIVCGDFNEILFNYEKEGCLPRAESCMEKFRQALEDCELHNLGFVGDAFTWRNHHHCAASYMRERLDRAVANGAWRSLFPLVQVINREPRHSDHRPIIVDVGEREDGRSYKPMEILHKFEACWLEEDECMTRVQEVVSPG
jgi:exonuclease III